VGTASLVFGLVSIGVGLLATGWGITGIIQNFFYPISIGFGSGIGLFIIGGLLLRKYDKDKKKEKTQNS